MLADSISAGDTLWRTYTGSSFSDCSFSIVPSVIRMPVMSAKMVRAWADSGAVVVYDTLDTCEVHVPYGGDTLYYTVDVPRGLIIGFYWYDFLLSIDVTHGYFYGYDKGVYYLQKVSSSMVDSGIEYGGYLFSNIRVNGQPLTTVKNRPRPEQCPFAIFPAADGCDRMAYTGAQEGMRITAFDLLGRSLFATSLQGGGGILDLNRLCRGTGCRNGPIMLRVSGQRQAAFVIPAIVR
jgi:hypothetical protein